MVDSSARSQVRAAGRAARTAIIGADRVRREQAMMAHLGSVEVLASPTVGVFVAHDGEPDLMPFVARMWDRGQVVALPILADDPDDRTMLFSTWARDMTLTPGRYGIPVPPPTQSSILAPDCLLVSLTAFDSQGNRMGRGAGFFDRYLATAHCDVVGVGFETQRVAQVPIQDHDVAMPVLVTDLGVRYMP